MRSLQSLDLLFDLFPRFRRNHLLFDFLAIRLDVFGEVFPFAELRLNRFQLLSQEVLALRLVHLALRGRRDFLLHRQKVDLAREHLVDFLQTLDGIDRFENALRFFELEIEVRCGEVGEARGIVEVRGDDHHFGRNVLAEGDGAIEVLFDGADERFHFQAAIARHRLFDARDLRFEKRCGLDEIVDARARQSLHEDANAAVGQLEHSHDDGDGAGAEEIFFARIFVLKILLSGEHDDAVLGEGLIDGVDRLLARHRKRHDDERKDHQVLERKHRKDVRDFYRLFFGRFVRFRHLYLILPATLAGSPAMGVP